MMEFGSAAANLESRAKALCLIFFGMGVMGFLYLCVAASTCGACYVTPCVHPPGLKMLYTVNSSLCFAGSTTGMFFCFLSGWGALLTLRRRASVMGFGHFFGATCVTFLVAVQSAGMWGAEATLLEQFGYRKVYEEAVIDGIYEQVRVKPNHALHRACRFLFTISVLMSVALMILAPLYFVSRDVYEENGVDNGVSLRRRAEGSRSLHISSYDPIDNNRVSAGGDDERQYLGRAQFPMRPIRPQFREADGGGGQVDGV